MKIFENIINFILAIIFIFMITLTAMAGSVYALFLFIVNRERYVEYMEKSDRYMDDVFKM